jgi:hypothetical protein
MKQQMQERSGTWRFLACSVLLLCAQAALAADGLSFSLSNAIGYNGVVSDGPSGLLVRFADPTAPCRDMSGPQTALAVRAMLAGRIVPGASVQCQYDDIVPGLTLIRLPEGISAADAAVRFAASDGVLYAEPNYRYPLQKGPNDPNYKQQWDLNNTGQNGGLPGADIRAQTAWDIQTGKKTVIVAILDTGMDMTNPEVGLSLWENTKEVDGNPDVDDDGNGKVDDYNGWNFLNDTADPTDDVYHGTYVAGIIGAFTNDMMGTAGTCWQVSLMPLKVADAKGTNLDAAVAAIQYAVASGAKIINCSWGSPDYSESLKNAIEEAGKKGVLVVAAAGNGSRNIDHSPVYPASYNLYNIISVLATNNRDQLASTSNYGRGSVDLGEPGEGILGVMPMTATEAMTAAGLTPVLGTLKGTSVAAPHVSGACALLWSQSPDLLSYHVKHILMTTVDPVLPGLCLSQGRLNMAKALTLTKAISPVVVVPGGRTTPAVTKPVAVNARTLVQYDAIQKAINDANNGDEIIADGKAGSNTIYFEHIDFKGKAITVRSGSALKPTDPNIYPDTTFISGLVGEGSVVTFTKGEGRDSVLKGFTIGWGVTENGAGIRIDSASPTITHCVISHNQASSFGGGIDCFAGSPEINNCVISDNVAFGEFATGGGLNFEESSASVSDCIIRNNTCMNAGGGITCNNASPTFVNCFVMDNAGVEGCGQFYLIVGASRTSTTSAPATSTPTRSSSRVLAARTISARWRPAS